MAGGEECQGNTGSAGKRNYFKLEEFSHAQQGGFYTERQFLHE